MGGNEKYFDAKGKHISENGLKLCQKASEKICPRGHGVGN